MGHPAKAPIRVDLGPLESTAISAVLVNHKGDGTADLGVNVLVPVSIPGATKPHYKGVTVALVITEAQRLQLIEALTGKQLEGNGTHDEGTKGAAIEGEGSPSLAPHQQHTRGR